MHTKITINNKVHPKYSFFINESQIKNLELQQLTLKNNWKQLENKQNIAKGTVLSNIYLKNFFLKTYSFKEINVSYN